MSAFKTSILAFICAGRRGGWCGFCLFELSGVPAAAGRPGNSRTPHKPSVIAAPCSPGEMSSTCWSKPRGRGTCERPTGKPTEQGIKVRVHEDGRARTPNQGKIKISRASLTGTIHHGWPLSGSLGVPTFRVLSGGRRGQ